MSAERPTAVSRSASGPAEEAGEQSGDDGPVPRPGADARGPGAPTTRAAPRVAERSPETGPIPLRRRRVGSSELRVFPVGLNGAGFGSTVGTDAAFDILDTYRALGGNFIDTDAANEGRSEAFIGRWLRSRGARSSVVLASTVGVRADSPGVGREAIVRAVDLSLERLQTDYIDLLLLGLDDAAEPFEETLLAVDDLVRAGKVRHAGAADHDANRLVEARVIAAMLGVTPLVAAQCDYGLANRQEFEGSLSGVIVEQGLGALPRLPLAASTPARRRRRILAALDPIARAHHVSPATIGFAWLLSKPGVCAPVTAVSSIDQLLDLVAATTVQLTRHQVAALDRASD